MIRYGQEQKKYVIVRYKVKKEDFLLHFTYLLHLHVPGPHDCLITTEKNTHLFI